ncbi:DUF2243 domain-containing protein [Alkalicoccus luteus]|uniref:DUF2243 domain-containing protein n=1 Tax=Alkalicoccus luteus TaxID=1237094 RepID=A0A969PPL5_9BACI|nr:DUF2243 domain-containing protein [Alkalicoccus luteus]NJP37093.1 DUF2243 domain-containing protein [Alkalicoccus luteus]
MKDQKKMHIGSFLLGFGFLGALDGIVFHQLLQWHSVIHDAPTNVQIISDGVFHFAVTLTIMAGALLLWLSGKPQEPKRAWMSAGGLFLIGGGLFNLVEGIINHHILQIHRVHPEAENPLLFDLAFLASGVILLGAGFLLRKKVKQRDL